MVVGAERRVDATFTYFTATGTIFHDMGAKVGKPDPLGSSGLDTEAEVGFVVIGAMGTFGGIAI